MHGCGNDFIVTDARAADISAFLEDSQAVSMACDRRFGVGCDQLNVIAPAGSPAVYAAFRHGLTPRKTRVQMDGGTL